MERSGNPGAPALSSLSRLEPGTNRTPRHPISRTRRSALRPRNPHAHVPEIWRHAVQGVRKTRVGGGTVNEVEASTFCTTLWQTLRPTPRRLPSLALRFHRRLGAALVLLLHQRGHAERVVRRMQAQLAGDHARRACLRERAPDT